MPESHLDHTPSRSRNTPHERKHTFYKICIDFRMSIVRVSDKFIYLRVILRRHRLTLRYKMAQYQAVNVKEDNKHLPLCKWTDLKLRIAEHKQTVLREIILCFTK